jgi:hypothetical protein
MLTRFKTDQLGVNQLVLYNQSTYFTIRGQSYFSRLPQYCPPPPSPSPPGECVPSAFVVAGRQTRRAERGMGGQYFGRRENRIALLQ